MQDRAIVALFLARDEEAIVQTERKYGAYLLRLALRILADREDSAECVNDTYLAAWRSIPPHRPEVLSTYLARIVRQSAIDRYRRNRSAKRGGSEFALSLEELGDSFASGDTPDGTLDAALLSDAITRFLHAQSEQAQRLFVLRYYYFLPLAEAAKRCDMSEAAAKSQLHRTRRALRDYLEKEGFDP